MIEVNNLTKNFGPFSAVKGIDFNINRGEVVGLLGPNGAGKTTTMRMMTGYYYPTDGDVKLDGVSIKEERQHIQEQIGYLPEAASSYTDMVVADYLDFVAESRKLSLQQKRDGIDLAVTSTSLESNYYRPINVLSKGYKQRVGLAAALLHDPSVLILDEPTSGLDPNQIVEIQNLIRKLAENKTIILSTHILKEVEASCERVIIIHNGDIVLDDKLAHLQQDSQNKYTYKVTLKGNISNARETLAQSLSTEQVAVSDSQTELLVRGDDNAGETIFNTAVQNNWVLREMAVQRRSLEEIFQSLTRGK